MMWSIATGPEPLWGALASTAVFARIDPTHFLLAVPCGHAACSYPPRVSSAPVPSPTSPSPTPVGSAAVPTTRNGTVRAWPVGDANRTGTTAPAWVPIRRMVDDPNAISPGRAG